MCPSAASDAPVLSVVVPVFNEEPGLAELHRRLTAALGDLDCAVEVIYVDDGSTNRSVPIIRGWVTDGTIAVSLVEPLRNFGPEMAMSAGLVALMHADLQDPPELLGEVLAAVRGGADVAYARRIGRDESAVKRVLATGFYALMRRIARVPYQGQAGDSYEQVPVEYRRAGRHAGRGASYPQLLGLAVEAVTTFSEVPLRLATEFGIITAQISGLAVVVIILVLALFGVVHPCVWAGVLIAVLFLSGVQLITVGILGRYVAQVHEEVRSRPLYLVDWVALSSGEVRTNGGLIGGPGLSAAAAVVLSDPRA